MKTTLPIFSFAIAAALVTPTQAQAPLGFAEQGSTAAVQPASDGNQDAEALARGTISLLNDRDRAKAMGCEAVKLYREVFDLEHTIAALRGV